MRNKTFTIFGMIVATASLGVAVVAMEPSAWAERLMSWKVISIVVTSTLIDNLGWIAFGIPIGFLMYLTITLKSKPSGQIATESNAISQEEFEAKYSELYENEDIVDVCIMGYTSETVSNYVKFKHKYEDSVQFRVLNRSWKAEQADEALFNKTAGDLRLRPWDKSRHLKAQSEQPWNYTATQTLRHYDFMHPIIKCVILKSRTNSFAFFSFYECKALPEEGGSPFKGDNESMIYLSSKDQNGSNIIKYLESQFEFIWKYRSFNTSQLEQRTYNTYFSEVFTGSSTDSEN